MPTTKTPATHGLTAPTFIDLFAGIGGFRLGFESQGCRCVFSSEIDKWARQTYQANHDDLPHGDITGIEARDIPDHDILTGGFSMSGLQHLRCLQEKQFGHSSRL